MVVVDVDVWCPSRSLSLRRLWCEQMLQMLFFHGRSGAFFTECMGVFFLGSAREGGWAQIVLFSRRKKYPRLLRCWMAGWIDEDGWMAFFLLFLSLFSGRVGERGLLLLLADRIR